MTHLIPADYHGYAIQLIEKDGSRWLTARDLGLCLGYSEANARQGILKVYERHLDEFTDKDSTVVKLTTVDGKERNARIFSPSSCRLRHFPLSPCLRRLFVHNGQRGLKTSGIAASAPVSCGFFMPAGAHPLCREGEEYKTRKGNNSGRLFPAFEPPDTHCYQAWDNLKKMK